MTIQEAKARLDIPAVAARLLPNWKPQTSCHSPWREDKNPSFSVYDDGQKWKDLATGEHGDAVDFLAKTLDVARSEGINRFIAMAGGNHVQRQSRSVAPTPPTDSDDKRQKRRLWPIFNVPTCDEEVMLANLRGLPREGVYWAAIDGVLRVATCETHRCWIVRSTCGKNAQARRLDGQRLGADLKARTLAGSIASLPVGNYHDTRWPFVVLLEGGPDVLAAYAAIHRLGLLDTVAVCGMLGASMRPPYGALATLSGRRVRILQHNDEAGEVAADAWARLIHNAGGTVDIWVPNKAGTDLNDIFQLQENEMTAELSEAFDFVKGVN